LFSLERKRLQEVLTAAFQYLKKGIRRKTGTGFFVEPVVIGLDIRKKFLQ